MTDKDAIRLAIDDLEVLRWYVKKAAQGHKIMWKDLDDDVGADADRTIAALRARLADGERQEPVAHCYKGHGGTMRAYWGDKVHVDHKPLFTAPPTAATTEAQAYERAAKVCEQFEGREHDSWDYAAAIRKLAQEGDK